MRVFIGMETSGTLRKLFAAQGHEVISCDLLPAQDETNSVPLSELRNYHANGGHLPLHVVGDVFDVLDTLWALGWWPERSVFHPDCTYLTVSAAWAFKDPDYVRYPGVGYHQKVKPGTLVGQARRDARDNAVALVKRIQELPIEVKVIENPIGSLSSLWMTPCDVTQPYQFGNDASKATCLWFLDKDGNKIDTKLVRDPAKLVAPTLRANGKSYWSNQTDTGQNRLSPDDDRWQKRSDTFSGIGQAIVNHIS